MHGHFKSASAVRKEEIKIALPALWEIALGWHGSLIVLAMLQKSCLVSAGLVVKCLIRSVYRSSSWLLSFGTASVIDCVV